MALGSRPDGVLAMVIRDGMKLVLAGVVAGLLPALLAPRVMRSLLVSASSDSLIFVATVLVLVLVAAFACYIPARRAAKVDPMVALRYE
jgi:putative ABC transport system permease protein